MGRRALAALAALLLWVVGLFVLTEVRPDWVLPVIGGAVGAIGVVVLGAHVRQQRRLSGLSAALRRSAKRSERLRADVEGAVERLQAEVLALRDLMHGTAISASKAQRLTEDLEPAVGRLVEGLVAGGPGAAPSIVFRQLEALIGLYSIVAPRRPFPQMGSWPASPEMLLFLYGEVRARRPELIVECGSGVSTIVMAYALEHNGSGRLVSLEHDETYAESTERLITEHGLQADVRLAPLGNVEIDGAAYRWYIPEAIPEGPISFLFVDGPPGNVGPQARYPALPLLADSIAGDGVVVVDDYDRPAEREVVESWLAAIPGWSLRELTVDRGGALLYRA